MYAKLMSDFFTYVNNKDAPELNEDGENYQFEYMSYEKKMF